MFASRGVGPDYVNVAQLLIQRGAEVNLQNAVGDTALIVAARNAGGTSLVQLLLNSGASVHLANKKGETALSVSQEGSRQLLRSRAP